jgi:hypothetical protein
MKASSIDDMKTICIGIKGRVLGLHPKSGKTLWETHLVSSQFVNVHREGNDVIAATRGEVFCIDPKNGKIRWKNTLPGMGWGMVTIAGAEGNTQAIIEALHREQQAAAAG